jgi:hypothetical protein
VISLLFGPYPGLLALLTAADDVEGDVKDLNRNMRDVSGSELVFAPQFEDALDDRLGVHLGVVRFEDRAGDPLQVLPRPVERKWPGDRVDESFIAFEHLQRTRDAAQSQKGGMCAPEGSVGISQAFPVGQRAGARDPQGVESGATERQGVGRVELVEAEGFGDARRHGIGALRGVIKAFGSHRRDLTEAALHLVGHRQGGWQFPSTASGVLSRGQDSTEVIAGVAGFIWGQIAVVEVQVTHQGAIVERGAVGGRAATPDQCTVSGPAELVDLQTDQENRFSRKCTDGTAEGVQHANLELLAGSC